MIYIKIIDQLFYCFVISNHFSNLQAVQEHMTTMFQALLMLLLKTPTPIQAHVSLQLLSMVFTKSVPMQGKNTLMH